MWLNIGLSWKITQTCTTPVSFSHRKQARTPAVYSFYCARYSLKLHLFEPFNFQGHFIECISTGWNSGILQYKPECYHRSESEYVLNSHLSKTGLRSNSLEKLDLNSLLWIAPFTLFPPFSATKKLQSRGYSFFPASWERLRRIADWAARPEKAGSPFHWPEAVQPGSKRPS